MCDVRRRKANRHVIDVKRKKLILAFARILDERGKETEEGRTHRCGQVALAGSAPTQLNLDVCGRQLQSL